jgi:hypothetical protein
LQFFPQYSRSFAALQAGTAEKGVRQRQVARQPVKKAGRQLKVGVFFRGVCYDSVTIEKLYLYIPTNGGDSLCCKSSI